ncbi:MAG: tetratricopeptide repeat protein [Chloroflexota bacterium]
MTPPNNRHVLLVSAAIILRQAGEDQRAIEILQEAIQEKPDYESAYVLLGALSQAAGNVEQAEIAFRKALEIDPNNSEALQGMGLFLDSQGRFPEALPYLQKQLKKNPADQITLDGLMNALTHLPGREKEIEDALRNAWEKSQNADLGIRYGRYLLDYNDPREARSVFAAVVDVSKTARTLVELALSCFIMKEYDDAIQHLQEAALIDPQFDRAWRGLSQCYNTVGDYDKALESAEQAIAINPNHYRNWQAKSDVLLSLKQYEKVLETSQKGIELIKQKDDSRLEAEPVLAVLFLQRIKAYIEMGKLDDAITEAETARIEIPTDVRFYLYPAEILVGLGKPEQALEILEAATDSIAIDQLSTGRYQMLHQLGRAQEAWDTISPLLEHNPDKKLETFANIGVNYYSRGLTKPAIAIYRQIIAFNPNNVRFSTNLAYFLIGETQYEEAEALLLGVIKSDGAGKFGQIALCNLAYLYNLIGDYSNALEIAAAVFESTFSTEGAYLRVPFWVNHQMLSDPDPIPGREITLGNAAMACGAAAAMALGKLDTAERMVNKFQPDNEPLLQEMLLGCFEQAKKKYAEARQHWKAARKLSKRKPEQSTLDEWIQASKGK